MCKQIKNINRFNKYKVAYQYTSTTYCVSQHSPDSVEC